MNNICKTASIYRDILKVAKSYNKSELNNWDIEGIITKAKLYLHGVSIIDDYGLNIDPNKISSFDWNELREYIYIGNWGDKYNRTISWSDNGEQPKDELLLTIKFPTGAYIFGDDYPTKLFEKFFNELKAYNPKYSDTANKNLLFSMDNAKDVFNDFDGLLKKYHQINIEDRKQRKIDKMKSELQKLEGNA